MPVRITKTRKPLLKTLNEIENEKPDLIVDPNKPSNEIPNNTHKPKSNTKKTRQVDTNKTTAKTSKIQYCTNQLFSVNLLIDEINNSSPLIFSIINDPIKIMCMIITKDNLRIKSAIFKTLNGDIYVNSKNFTFNFIIPEDMQIDSMIAYLIEMKDKYAEIIVNFYKSNDVFCFIGGATTITTDIEQITQFCTKVKYHYSYTNNFNEPIKMDDIYDFVIDCVCALKVNDSYNGFVFEFDHGKLYAVVNREENSLNFYNNEQDELFLINVINNKTLRIYSSIMYKQDFFTIVTFANKLSIIE